MKRFKAGQKVRVVSYNKHQFNRHENPIGDTLTICDGSDWLNEGKATAIGDNRYMINFRPEDLVILDFKTYYEAIL